MILCDICQRIPFREILTGDPSHPKSVTYYLHRFHESITTLIASGASCKLCREFTATITISEWYAEGRTDADMTKPVWLWFIVAHQASRIGFKVGNPGNETGIYGQDLEIYVTLGEPKSKSPTHSCSLKQLDMWLRSCNKDHPDCSHIVLKPMQLPTRVLDLGTLPGRKAMSNTNNWRDLFMNDKCRLLENRKQEMG
jgi:hypothetical protein